MPKSAAETTLTSEQLRTTANRLRIGIGAFRRRAQETKAGGDVAPPQLAALSRLERLGPMTNTELARHEQITPQTMGGTVATLEERGLVERRPDPDDGRRSILSATPAGIKAVRAGRSALVDKITAAMSQSFSADEIATLDAAAALLERLAERL